MINKVNGLKGERARGRAELIEEHTALWREPGSGVRDKKGTQNWGVGRSLGSGSYVLGRERSHEEKQTIQRL